MAVVTDRLGSVRANSTGGTFRYYPYGEEYTATAQEKVKFGTYYRDQDTGLDYADQRFYRSISGTFVTADPYRASAKGANNPADPGSWNRYAYAGNDPMNYFDPTGQDIAYAGSGACVVGVGEGAETVNCDYYRLSYNFYLFRPIKEDPVPKLFTLHDLRDFAQVLKMKSRNISEITDKHAI